MFTRLLPLLKMLWKKKMWLLVKPNWSLVKDRFKNTLTQLFCLLNQL